MWACLQKKVGQKTFSPSSFGTLLDSRSGILDPGWLKSGSGIRETPGSESLVLFCKCFSFYGLGGVGQEQREENHPGLDPGGQGQEKEQEESGPQVLQIRRMAKAMLFLVGTVHSTPL
jgi:hypothetical protein